MAIPSVTISANKNELLIGETLTLEVKNTELDPGDVFLAYRWQKDGVDIPGATADTYTTTVDGTTAGDYTLILKHGADEESATETTSDTITVTTYPVIAFGTDLPATKSVVTGKELTLTVAVTGGKTPYTYVWKRGSTVVSGDSATLTISAAASGDAGSYTVEVTDSLGNRKTSSACVVSVTPALSFDKNLSPTSSVTHGSALILSVTVLGGSAPYSYAWTKDDSPVGEDSDTLNIASADLDDAGSYKVVVTDANSDTITSTVCVVTVNQNSDDLVSKWTVHPIPWRDTSFTPIGYWVLDEILYQKAQGKDWKTDYADYKYSEEVQTILKAFMENGECEIQDSRNGYIHKMSEI